MLTRMLFAITCLIASVANAENIDACDAAVAHPSDPSRVGAGVPTREVVTHIAIPACRAALASQPNHPRFQYQLGRALYYWAEANDGDPAEAVSLIKKAADQQYLQALFVLGYLYKQRGDVCAARKLIQRAAERGLKSARLTYPGDVLAQTYAACGPRLVEDQTLLDYLSAAREQAEGYYENLLITNLQRELNSRVRLQADRQDAQ